MAEATSGADRGDKTAASGLQLLAAAVDDSAVGPIDAGPQAAPPPVLAGRGAGKRRNKGGKEPRPALSPRARALSISLITGEYKPAVRVEALPPPFLGATQRFDGWRTERASQDAAAGTDGAR